MPKREALKVWLYGTHVATLTSTRAAEVRCEYTSDAMQRWPLNTPVLSCSLPLSTRRLRGEPFFDGLLPEGQHRQAMAAEARVPSYDTFGLLARFGRDVAGAAEISAEAPALRSGDIVEYSTDALEAEVVALPERPLAIYDDSELSIAGLQDKLLLVDLGDGRWGRPVHGRPSTHILKVEDRRFAGMAEMEAAALRLARAAGLTSVEASVVNLGGYGCLIVERFDRRTTPAGLERIHQEDVCQALGRNAEAHQGRGKYERAGGPSFREVAALLDKFGRDPGGELVQLARVAAFTALIGNADAHGKNLALLHDEEGSVTLAPLYDTVPTMLWPQLRSEAAMTINGQSRLDRVRLGDIAAEAACWEASPDVTAAVAQTTEAVAKAAGEHGVPDELAAAVSQRCEAFLP